MVFLLLTSPDGTLSEQVETQASISNTSGELIQELKKHGMIVGEAVAKLKGQEIANSIIFQHITVKKEGKRELHLEIVRPE